MQILSERRAFSYPRNGKAEDGSDEDVLHHEDEGCLDGGQLSDHRE